MTNATSAPISPCITCSHRCGCIAPCAILENMLPSMEQGRVDFEDLPRIFQGRAETSEILNFEEFLPDAQREIVRLYYREGLFQREIGQILNVTQQAVNDYLRRIRRKVGKHLIKKQKK